MDDLCTDGGRFRSYKRGELLIKNGGLYAVDSFRCDICGKTILGGVAGWPLCPADTPEADKLIESAAAKGMNCYGRPEEKP